MLVSRWRRPLPGPRVALARAGQNPREVLTADELFSAACWPPLWGWRRQAATVEGRTSAPQCAVLQQTYGVCGTGMETSKSRYTTAHTQMAHPEVRRDTWDVRRLVRCRYHVETSP